MSNFDVKLEGLKGNIETLDGTAQIMNMLEGRLQGVIRGIDKDQFADFKVRLLKEAGKIKTEQQGIINLKTGLEETINSYEKTENKLMKNANIKGKSVGKKESTNNDEAENPQEKAFTDSMKEQFGFSEEDAKLLYDAYEAFMKNGEYANLSNKEKINLFFSNMASLQENYSSNSKLFKLMGKNPSPEDAVKFFNDLGIDGSKLQEIIKTQHGNTDGYRDFAHECAMYSVYANTGIEKTLAGTIDNIDALVGYKGDIYSKSMGLDDVRSDIAAANIYKRMLDRGDGNIFAAMNEYNQDSNVNPSLEFLKNMGDGDPQKGLQNLKKEINSTSAATEYLSGDYAGYGESSHYPGYGYPHYGSDEYGGYGNKSSETVADCKEKFLEYIQTESGIK